MDITRKKIANVPVDFNLSKADVLGKMDEFIAEGGPHYFYTVNPEFIMTAQKDREFMEILNASDLSIPDGIGVLFAKEYLDRLDKVNKGFLFPIQALFLGVTSFVGSKWSVERLTGADLIYNICELAAQKGYTVGLLGGWEKDFSGKMKKHHGDMAEKTKEKLISKYPELKVVCASSDFSRKPKDDKPTQDYIHECMSKSSVEEIDILFVAYGPPEQEKWLVRNMDKIPAKVGIGVGGTFDFVVGHAKRAPSFIRKCNMEWLFRLITQPWRLKRVLAAFPIFPLFVYYLSVKSYINNQK